MPYRANMDAMNLKHQPVNLNPMFLFLFFSQIAFKDIYYKSVKKELLTGLGFMESVAYLCSIFCQ